MPNLSTHSNDDAHVSEPLFKARLDDACDLLRGWLWEMDASLRFSYFTESVEAIAGKAPEWHYGKTRTDVAGDSILDRAMLQHLEQIAAHESFDPLEFCRLEADQQFWMRTVGKPLFDGDGRFLGYRGFAFDVTREKNAELGREAAQKELAKSQARLERQNALFRAALSNMRQGLAMFDRDGRLLVWNQNFQELFGFPDDVLADHAPHSELVDSMSSRMANSETFTERQLPSYPSAKDALSVASLRHSIEMLRDGRAIAIWRNLIGDGGWVATYEDVTERERQQQRIKKYALQLERAKTDLQAHRANLEKRVAERTSVIEAQARELEQTLEKERRLNQLKRSFVAMASHEFRTPLAVIDGTLSRLRRRAEAMNPDDLNRYCDKIGSSVKRMIALIESTLSAERLEAGALTVEPKPVDVAEIVRACCERQAEISSSHRITLEMDALPSPVMVDPLAMEQVLTNLLSNAVKYSELAERVDVRATCDGGEIVVAVRDYGVGIDAEDIKEIGDRYFRAKSSVGISGTGIGLNLSKTLLEAHGGAMGVASTVGEGSTFTIRVPVLEAQLETEGDGDARSASV